jgi:hypothetical protein
MTTIADSIVGINGVISTDKSVLQNLQSIASAAGVWITYDVTQGKWAVVINKAGTSVASFNDSNIIGSINISGKGVNELYNAATMEFPHKDLRDQKDYVDLTIADADRFTNELDNRLNISNDLINDPIQAQYIASVELKQSRVDKIIQFRTDYSQIGLKAGDLIDVTSTMYGYTSKVFRITRLEESDDDVLSISITALEYDAAVYSTAGLTREPREKKTGIVPRQVNTAVRTSDSLSTATQNTEGSSSVLTNLAIANALAAGIGPLFNFLKSSSNATTAGFKANNPGSSIPSYYSTSLLLPGSTVCSYFQAYAGSVTPFGGIQGEGFSGDENAYIAFSLAVPACDNLFVTVTCPYAQFTLFPYVLNAALVENIIFTGGNIFTEGGVDYFVNPEYELLNTLVVDPDVQYIPAGNLDTWYIPMRFSLLNNGSVIYQQITNLFSPTFSFGFNGVPETELQFLFEPVYHTSTDYQLYHGGHTSLGQVSDLKLTLQCISAT